MGSRGKRLSSNTPRLESFDGISKDPSQHRSRCGRIAKCRVRSMMPDVGGVVSRQDPPPAAKPLYKATL